MLALLRCLLLLLLSAACRGASTSDSPPAAATNEPPLSLHVGDTAPDFSALSQTGYSVSLSQFLNQPVAVYFCPDPGCGALTTELADEWLRLKQRLSMILIVVPGDYNQNRAFSSEHELPLLLLTDPDRQIASRYGVAGGTRAGTGPGERTGFLIATDGKISRIFDNPSPTDHVRELMPPEP